MRAYYSGSVPTEAHPDACPDAVREAVTVLGSAAAYGAACQPEADGEIEIWLSDAPIEAAPQGYWRRPQATPTTIRAPDGVFRPGV